MTNLLEMERQLAEMQARVTAERARVKSETLEALRAMLASGTLTHDDLRELLPAPKRDRTGERKGGGKVPPKYRNPENGETWGGQGAIPLWLRDKTQAERERFLIPDSERNASA
jgi:DNA-binding protein H-NS